MIKSLFNKLLIVLYFIFGALLLEIVAFHALNLGALPQYFMLDLSIILIVGLIVYCIPNFTAQYIIYTILLLVQIVFIYINYTLFSIYGDLFSFDMLYLVGEAAAAVTKNFVYFKIIFQLVSIFIALSIFGFVLLKICKKDKIKLKQHYSIFNIIVLLSVQFFSLGYYTHMRNYINVMGDLTDMSYIESDAFLMNTNFLKSESYSKFGFYGYMLNLFVNSFGTINEAHKAATIDYFKNGNIYNDSAFFGVDAPNGQYNNVIVIMMESLEWFAFSNGNVLSEDENGEPFYDNLKVLQNLSYELTPNIYSIVYGEDYLSDEQNLNKNNDSMIFRNFFAKSKTNISEGYGLLGNYPVGEALTSFAGKNYDSNLNAFDYSLANTLKNNGFYTTYVHSNVARFYDRQETHSNLGFQNLVFKDNLKDQNGKRIYTGSSLNWNNWAPEGDFARYAIDQIVPQKCLDENSPFFTFYLNVSSHGSYLESDNKNDGDVIRYLDYVKYGKENCNLVKYKSAVEDDNKFFYDDLGNKITDVETLQTYYPNENYIWELDSQKFNSLDNDKDRFSNYYYNILHSYGDYDAATDSYEESDLTSLLTYYQCGVMGLDEAIGVIINKLKAEGIYNKTDILLYSDHFCYYNNVSNDVKGYPLGDTLSIDLNTIPFIISSPGLKSSASSSEFNLSYNERFCSAYDIIPTILDLLGIPFNERFYLGHSIFRPADYVYTIDQETGKARPVEEGEQGKDFVIYYSNTGGIFSLDCYSIDLKTIYSRNGQVLNDSYLADLFKSETANQLIKLNFLSILNRNHLYNKI